MMRRNLGWLAALAVIAVPATARAGDGWFLGGGSSTSESGATLSSVGLAFESQVLPVVSLVVRGDYDFQNSTTVYRSAVFGMRLRAPLRYVQPWLEAGIGLGGNASTSDGGMATSASFGASVPTSLGFEPFAEARLMRIADTPGAGRMTEFRLGGQFKFRGEE